MPTACTLPSTHLVEANPSSQCDQVSCCVLDRCCSEDPLDLRIELHGSLEDDGAAVPDFVTLIQHHTPPHTLLVHDGIPHGVLGFLRLHTISIQG